jgi:hypothetical protein
MFFGNCSKRYETWCTSLVGPAGGGFGFTSPGKALCGVGNGFEVLFCTAARRRSSCLLFSLTINLLTSTTTTTTIPAPPADLHRLTQSACLFDDGAPGLQCAPNFRLSSRAHTGLIGRTETNQTFVRTDHTCGGYPIYELPHAGKEFCGTLSGDCSAFLYRPGQLGLYGDWAIGKLNSKVDIDPPGGGACTLLDADGQPTGLDWLLVGGVSSPKDSQLHTGTSSSKGNQLYTPGNSADWKECSTYSYSEKSSLCVGESTDWTPNPSLRVLPGDDGSAYPER